MGGGGGGGGEGGHIPIRILRTSPIRKNYDARAMRVSPWPRAKLQTGQKKNGRHLVRKRATPALGARLPPRVEPPARHCLRRGGPSQGDVDPSWIPPSLCALFGEWARICVPCPLERGRKSRKTPPRGQRFSHRPFPRRYTRCDSPLRCVFEAIPYYVASSA